MTVDRCAACDAPLAADQRFCLACGLRCAPDELRLAALSEMGVSAPALAPVVPLARRPVVRSAAITAVVVLSMGVAIGATIGPATLGETAAAQSSPLLVVTAPAPAPPVSTPASDTGAPADTESFDAASADTSAPAEPTAVADPTPTPTPTPTPSPQPAPQAMPSPKPTDPQPTRETPPAGSVQLAGSVVDADPAAARFTLLGRDGDLREIHAAGCGVQRGDDLHLRARLTANGTWAADRIRRLPDPARRAVLVGTVAWVDAATNRYAIGARGVTILVTVPLPPADPSNPAPPPPSLPAIGDRVGASLDLPAPLAAGRPAAPLMERARTVLPPADPATSVAPLELRGRVASIDPQARTLALALDPAEASLTVTLSLPVTIDPAKITPGQGVAVSATHADAGYAVTGISADGDAGAANDPTAIQGDQRPRGAPPSADAATTTCTLLERAPNAATTAAPRAPRARG